VPEHLEDAGHELVLRVSPRRFTHHLFFVRQLLVEEQRVAPVETRVGSPGHVKEP
jgi:hypothetical protein